MLIFKRSERAIIPITINATGEIIHLHILKISRGGVIAKVQLGLEDPNHAVSIPTQGHSFQNPTNLSAKNPTEGT
jgi:hypothetical protein